MLKPFSIKLDLVDKTSNPPFWVDQNDLNTIELNIAITKNKQPIDITGLTFRIVIKKPSRQTVIQDCEIVDALSGKVKVLLDTQAYNESGSHQAQVYLYKNVDDAVKEVAATEKFSFLSDKAILNNQTVESSNEWQSINDALIQIDDTFVQLDDKIQEIQNADVYTKGQTDTKFNSVNNLLADIASQNNYSVIPTYTNGQLTKVEEKDSSIVKVSSTITYNPDGTVDTVTEVLNGKTVVSKLNYINGEFSTVTRTVL
ncbi:hypothetical protein CN692_24185 [Bacillus sp. AFS002410]|uniref:BppU family phage baseplate upper protein n=1 Tax=Bacillus sp. AFS002410 TaxID=2033481 RepID=UPI000BF11C22|nr:BppU family phage baseplate upper protein [Bacillus sp. AFS002410]PEJ48209.1 hypothetical protein CN692_24185 [Bacillus sp. AFS002410]